MVRFLYNVQRNATTSYVLYTVAEPHVSQGIQMNPPHPNKFPRII